jgi:hypothetical protein
VRALVRAGIALALLAAAVAACRGAGALLPGAIAAGLGLALAAGLPGVALLRGVGLDARLGALGSLAVLPMAGLAAWVAPLAVALLLGLPFAWILWPTLVVSALVLALTPGIAIDVPPRPAALTAAATLAMAAFASRWQPPHLTGDAFFHAGRVRKLLDLPDLSFSGLSAYRDGHVHAGYAFPLLHAVEAAAIDLAGLEPSAGYLYLVAGCAALLPVVVFAAGRSLGGQTVGACAVMFALWDAVGRGDGVLDSIEQPSGFVFMVLFPVAVFLIAELRRSPDDRRVAAAVCGSLLIVALVHPTYALVLLAVLAAAVASTRRGVVVLAAASLQTAVVFGLIWAASLRGAPRGSGKALSSENFWIVSGHGLALTGTWIIQHRVEFLAATLLIVPLLFIRDRRYAFAASMAAGALALAALPGAAALLSEVIGNGQTRRVWGGIPWFYLPALAATLLAARERGRRLAAAALVLAAVSIAVQRWHALWGSGLTVVTSGVAVAATAVLVCRLVRPRAAQLRPVDAAPVVPALVLSVALLAGGLTSAGHAAASTLVHGGTAPLRHRLTPGLIAWMRDHDSAPFPVVLAPVRAGPSDLFTGIAFQLIGQADVYAVGLPQARTRAEPRSNPVARRRDVATFFDPDGSDAERVRILDRYGVDYVIVDVARTPQFAQAIAGLAQLTRVYEDRGTRPGFGRFEVFQVNR